MPYVPVAALKDYVGKELGRSEWLTIDQERINLFAEATGDYQFIHVDPVKAAQTPFGSTCLLYTSPSPRDGLLSRMPSSA